MGIGVDIYNRRLAAQDMRQRIALAWLQGETLSIPDAAAQIAISYPGALPDDDLRNWLFAEATRFGVPVDLKPAKQSRSLFPPAPCRM
jgi:hypothetical protein